MFHVIDTNNDHVISTHKQCYEGVCAAATYIADSNARMILDYMDEGEVDVEDMRIVIKCLGPQRYEVYTNGGDDVLLVCEHVPVRTFADLYADA